MSTISIITSFIGRLVSTTKSCLCLLPSLLKNGPTVVVSAGECRPLVILGNGPSLKRNLEDDRELLREVDTLAVNFFANSPEFVSIKPTYYVLADPHFFEKAESDLNVSLLIRNLNSIDFPMTLFIPSSAKLKSTLFVNPLLKIERFNFVAVEGFNWFENLMFKHRRGMPRPRNVMIPSIMVGIWLGYNKIYLVGADHSWLSTLSVNERNEVVSIQPHFYKEDEKEQKRIKEEYVKHPLHEVLESMMIAFRSYHRIQLWAEKQSVEILNSTPGSMIDAFPRLPLPTHNA